MQEIGIRQGRSTPFFLDSLSTVFVAVGEAAAKKSAWVLRRIMVLHEGVKEGDITPIHIPESDMTADGCTKYITAAV